MQKGRLNQEGEKLSRNPATLIGAWWNNRGNHSIEKRVDRLEESGEPLFANVFANELDPNYLKNLLGADSVKVHIRSGNDTKNGPLSRDSLAAALASNDVSPLRSGVEVERKVDLLLYVDNAFRQFVELLVSHSKNSLTRDDIEQLNNAKISSDDLESCFTFGDGGFSLNFNGIDRVFALYLDFLFKSRIAFLKLQRSDSKSGQELRSKERTHLLMNLLSIIAIIAALGENLTLPIEFFNEVIMQYVVLIGEDIAESFWTPIVVDFASGIVGSVGFTHLFVNELLPWVRSRVYTDLIDPEVNFETIAEQESPLVSAQLISRVMLTEEGKDLAHKIFDEAYKTDQEAEDR